MLSELLQATSREEAADKIAADPALVGQTQVALPLLRTLALQAAGPAGVIEAVTKAFPIYPQPSRTDEEWAAFWDAYVALCGTIPLSALKAAMLAHMAGPKREFLPKPGDLAELALKTQTPEALAYATALNALELARRARPEYTLRHVEPPKAHRVPTAAEKAAVHSMAADFSIAVAAEQQVEREARPKGALTCGRTVPGSHLTREMLVSLGRDPEGIHGHDGAEPW